MGRIKEFFTKLQDEGLTAEEIKKHKLPEPVQWMDNETGYMCTVCKRIFGPHDYGWPPNCDHKEKTP